MKVADVMTRRVISVVPEITAADAAKLMLQAKISGLPVVKPDGTLIGIVTESDFIRRTEIGTTRSKTRWLDAIFSPAKLADEFTRAHGRKVADIMTSPVHTAAEQMSLAEAVDVMESRNIKRLPVLNEKRLVGMLSRSDLMKAIVRQHESLQQAETTDLKIREEIINKLQQQPWAPIYGINVVVREGVVQLSGTIFDDRERYALIVAAETTPGVKEVRDHIAVIDPKTGELISRLEESRQELRGN
jgi:CBS domain-containing protein